MKWWCRLRRADASPVAAPVAALVEEIAAKLAASDLAFGHGTDNASDEALRLVMDTLGDSPPTAAARRRLDALLRHRIDRRTPVPYLTGTAWFLGQPMRVTRDVMIPRSPIAEVLHHRVWPWLDAPPGRVLDLCCGVGALGIVAGQIFPSAVVDLVDIDPLALELARENARRLGVGDRVEIIASDLFAAVAGRRYDLILCNPPYVPTEELDCAPPEFHHEPRTGLDGGADGLTVWRRVVAALDNHMTRNGVLVGEVGNLGREFEAAFPHLGAIWLELEHAAPQAHGFGVFVAMRVRRAFGLRDASG